MVICYSRHRQLIDQLHCTFDSGSAAGKTRPLAAGVGPRHMDLDGCVLGGRGSASLTPGCGTQLYSRCRSYIPC